MEIKYILLKNILIFKLPQTTVFEMLVELHEHVDETHDNPYWLLQIFVAEQVPFIPINGTKRF